MSTHEFPQRTVPAAQTEEQRPAAHLLPDGQACPQAPQLRASLVRLTQPLPHRELPTAHDVADSEIASADSLIVEAPSPHPAT